MSHGGNGTVSPSDIQPTAEPARARVNILIVDDQPANVLALEAVLEELGQNIVQAGSGKEALRCVLEKDFAVILMDVKMPEMNGFETAELIRQRDRSRHTPIIFLTAYEENELSLFRGYSLGAVDFLIKPLVPEVLRSKVSVFVALRQMTEELTRQAELLRQNERREHERRLNEERQRWEMERLRAEAAREKKIAEDLAEADRRKDEFLAMLGHELRNPLAPIVNALHVMRLREGDNSADQSMRDLVERQVRHLSRLVDDLLDVSRITRGKIQLRTERLELAPVVQRAVESSRPLIEERRHQLSVSVPEASIWLDADPTRLEQILSNLLTNAAKYTEEGGRVWIKAEHQDHEVVIRVRDTGIGISQEILPRVFDLFIQAERSLDRAQGGLGIGLTLVRQLVELHGGQVEACSAGPGKGSEFIVHLPLAHACEADGPPSEVVDVRVKAPRRVLIVDDNRDVAESMAVLLGMDGHHVEVAHNGEEALAAVDALRPEVILLDIGLPGLDGYEVARRLRKAEGGKQLLLVALTGYGQDQDRERCHASGFDLHLVKPVDPQILREMIGLAHLAV
jgi:signal transduction histidine kinase